MADMAQEAMDALLVLHQPEKIEMWNPEAPINTFWDVSSQVLFSISQKLIQHQIVNYTDILRWLREVLTCRNAFLLRHRDYANVGSQVSVAKQAHIKLEVFFPTLCFFRLIIYILCFLLGGFLFVSVEYRYGCCSRLDELLQSSLRGG